MKHKPPLKAILLDMDGVLWRGSEPLIDIQHLFETIQSLGLRVYCVTNNSTRTATSQRAKLHEFGVDLDSSQIITSAEVTAQFLEKRFPDGGYVFVVGAEGIKEAVLKRGFQLLDGEDDRPAQAIVVGLDLDFTYHKYNLAVRYLQKGGLFVGTNPDLTIPTPSGPAPGAGSLIKGIEVSSGRKAHIIGKPFPGLFQEALNRADCLPAEALMIGDRLETDILGAQQHGLKAALVLSGITTIDETLDWKPAPDLIGKDVAEIVEVLRKNHGKLV